jgi:FkbM family methyltransferase
MTLNRSAYSPIALFAYRRPTHLQRVLRALSANPEAAQTELFVFSDGAKDGSVANDVDAVRSLLRRESGFAATHIICRDHNFGLARNITEGASEVLRANETVIVVEDDIVVSPFFLRFMNEALQTYRHIPSVGSVSGYCYPVAETLPETYFIRGSDCWSWATWRDRWAFYNPDSLLLFAELEARKLVHAFDLDGAMRFSQMLKDQAAGKNDSWAVRWHASCYLRNLLTLYPGRALAQNIGLDGSGTHCTVPDTSHDVKLSSSPVTVGGISIRENSQAREAIKRFFTDSRPANQGTPPPHLLTASDIATALWRRVVRALPSLVIDVPRRVSELRRVARLKAVPAVPCGGTLRSPTPNTPDIRQAWGLNALDCQIEKYLDFDNGFFVELGANDGHFQSNTFYYEQFRNWRGVLIEPAPNLFLQCRENRSPGNYIVCAACVSFDYKGEFVKIVYSNSMSVSLSLDSDIGDPLAHAELGRQFLKANETLFTFGALARTLNSILVEANAPGRVDFLSLDVEGAELDVLKGVDHNAYRFRYILAESRNLSRLQAYLESQHYRFVEKFNEYDYLFADTLT